ncbi:MAG: protein kinase [Acidobacteria bacterium]|nr:protein kinase [Acidobacteriota bacterium]
MNPQKWQQIEEIFQDALDLPAGERERFIAEKCGADEDVRAEVEKFIARFEQNEDFLESPVWTDSRLLESQARRELAASLDEELPAAENGALAGARIGAYRLIEELGRGGMGVVYAAERDDGEFRQKAAVKLIKRGMDTDFIVRRFRHERQILADLNHPNIARLIDGGTTFDQAPYFVMEFIEGAPLLKYAERENLDLRARIEIFLEICRAVAYAHEKKIVHRDIKPSNILVTRKGVPKLLDFGIAKIFDADSVHESLLPTATAMRLMTPEYASPEQVRGEPVTPAGDQYSLGILLYELIAGKRPYKFPSRAAHEIARVVCEETPSAPLTGGFQQPAAIDDDFRPAADSDLNRIVLKTLRKNPAERYRSVEEFAGDLERVLRGETVRAEIYENPESGSSANAEKIPDRMDPEPAAAPRFGAVRHGSPRARGVKQGAFITISSIVLIPLFVILIITGIIPPPVTAAIFPLLFFGGLLRILYALIFEPGRKQLRPPAENSAEIGTEPTGSETPLETRPENRTTHEKNTLGERLVAVLPFRTLRLAGSETAEETEFLGIGLADALITRLSNIRQFAVRPTSAVLRFNQAETDSFAAGRELKVDYVLEGRILRVENKLRLTVQLLDVAAGNTVWAERFDETLTDVLTLEDLISARVVESLLPHLSAGEARHLTKRGTDNPEAFEAYLRGRFHWNNFTEDSFRQAIVHYRRAIEIDPNFALGYAGIADYYIWLGIYGVLPTNEFYPPARDAALRAIALDPNLSEAHAALGLARLYGEYDWTASERDLRRAVELNPHNSVAHLWFSHVLFSQKRFAEGRRHLEKTLELDLLSFQPQNTLAWSYYFSRDHERALAEADRLVEKFPTVGQALYSRISFLSFAGRIEEAREEMERAARLTNDSLIVDLGFAQVYAAAGDRRAVEELIEKSAAAGRQFSNFYLALFYSYLRDRDAAFEHLERAFADRESLLVWLGVEPSLDPLRDDPRYEKLLRRIAAPL